MSEKEMKKLDDEAVEKVSGGIGSLKDFAINKPGSIFIKKYGGIPIKPPVKPIDLIKHFKKTEESND